MLAAKSVLPALFLADLDLAALDLTIERGINLALHAALHAYGKLN